MVARHLLRRMVGNALESVGENLYRSQLVNSERSFQAAMWEALRREFKVNGKAYKIFIEPRIAVENGEDLPAQVRFPDFVVCNRDAVVGIFELKFRPRGRASSRKDCETFSLLARSRDRLVVKNQRFYPRIEVKEYGMSDSVLFGWIAIAKHAGDLDRIDGIRDEHLKSFVFRTGGLSG